MKIFNKKNSSTVAITSNDYLEINQNNKINFKEAYNHISIGGAGINYSCAVNTYISSLLKRFDSFKSDPVKRSKKKMVILDIDEQFTNKFYNEKEWIKISDYDEKSIREWIKNDPRNIIVSVSSVNKEKSLKDASAFLKVLGRELLNGENLERDEDREIYLIINEFTDLVDNKETIIDLLNLVRKYNVSVLLTYQDVSNINSYFSKYEMETFKYGIATKIFL